MDNDSVTRFFKTYGDEQGQINRARALFALKWAENAMNKYPEHVNVEELKSDITIAASIIPHFYESMNSLNKTLAEPEVERYLKSSAEVISFNRGPVQPQTNPNGENEGILDKLMKRTQGWWK